MSDKQLLKALQEEQTSEDSDEVVIALGLNTLIERYMKLQLTNDGSSKEKDKLREDLRKKDDELHDIKRDFEDLEDDYGALKTKWNTVLKHLKILNLDDLPNKK